MKRIVTWTVFGSVLLGSVLFGTTATAFAGSAHAPEPKKPTSTPPAEQGLTKAALSKTALRDSYKPAVVNGMPWYRGATPVLLHNERRGAKARPILLLRILGDFDGGT